MAGASKEGDPSANNKNNGDKNTEGPSNERDPWDELSRLGHLEGSALPYFETGLALARVKNPNINGAPYRRHLDRLTEDVRAFAEDGFTDGRADNGTEASMRRAALVEVMHRRYGYRGDETRFEDADAADVARVIDRRSGLPVALGILHLEVCNRLDWPLVGIDFPGRFVLRMDSGTDRMILDPFDDLRVLEPHDLRAILKAIAGEEIELRPQYMAEMSPRRVLLRLEDNLRVRQVRDENYEAAAETLDRMLAFAPRTPDLWREAGLLNARIDHLQRAIEALETYLQTKPADEDGYEASRLLQELRTRLQ